MISNSNGSGSVIMAFESNEIEFTDNVDKTKKMRFDCSGIPTNTTVALAIPTASGNLPIATNSASVGQVLTATSSTTASWQNSGSGSAPPFNDNVALLQDSNDTTKKLIVDIANVPTGTTQTLQTPVMNNSDTIVVANSVQTVNFKTLQNSTANDATNDIAANKLKTAAGGAGTAVSISNNPTTGQVLTATSTTAASWQTPATGSNPPFNDNIALLQDSADTTKKLIIDVQNVPNATTQTIRTPAMNSLDIMVVESAVQTLNFKTLENATIIDATNDVAANKLKVAGQLASQAVSITNAPTTGQVLTAVTNFSASWQTPSTGGGGVVGTIFTMLSTPGTSTFNVNSKTLFALIEVYGAGGGSGASYSSGSAGGSGGSGGGAGGYSRKLVTKATLGNSFSYTVGAGGAGGIINGANGTAGGTSITPFCQATGGAGGWSAPYASTVTLILFPSDGGEGSGGDVNIKGGSGASGIAIGSANYACGGAGGSIGPFAGGAAVPVGNPGNALPPPSGFVGGASGGASQTPNQGRGGTTGGNGVIYITEFISA